MVSSRKPLHLDAAAAGPSTRTRATSRETAANTPAETATLRGGPDEDGTDSDATSSHRDPDAEALDRESNDEHKIDAQVQANLESENEALTYILNIRTGTETRVATERIEALVEPEAQGAWDTMDETKRNTTRGAG